MSSADEENVSEEKQQGPQCPGVNYGSLNSDP